MARTHVGRLVDFLRERGGKAALADIRSHFLWDDTKIDRVIADSGGRLKRTKMGRRSGVAQIGYELGGRGAVPLYADVHRVLESTWRAKKRWQAAIALDTAVGKRGHTGVWTHPDCVLAYYPAGKGNSTTTARLATFEIEPVGNMDIRSIYEAHAHGRGADHSWVLFCRGTSTSKGEKPADWERIAWAAKHCGIGVISMGNPGNASTWDVLLPAPRRTDGNRADFIDRAIPTSMAGLVDLDVEGMKHLT